MHLTYFSSLLCSFIRWIWKFPNLTLTSFQFKPFLAVTERLDINQVEILLNHLSAQKNRLIVSSEEQESTTTVLAFSEQPSQEHFELVPEQFQCDVCDKVFARKFTLKRHKELHTAELQTTSCQLCGKIVKNIYQGAKLEAKFFILFLVEGF